MELINDLSVNINKIAQWCNNYYDWLQFNTRHTLPLGINLDNLHKADYQNDLGRGGYFAPECGTSEGQFLSCLGYLYMYEATKQMKWLGMAEKAINAALDKLYIGEDFPSEAFNGFNYFVPNWLYCASQPYTSEAYYLNKQFDFVNGQATINTSYEARKVFQVVSTDATFLWDDPYATLSSGTSYTLESYTASGNSFTVKIAENYTGKAIVVYSDMGGSTIDVSQICEAYPVWRPMQSTEIAAACDALWWSYHCFKKFWELTGNARYQTLLTFTQDLIKYSCQLQDTGNYMTTYFKDDTVLSDTGAYKFDDGRSPSPTWTRNYQTDGSLQIDIPQGNGLLGIGVPIDADTDFNGRYYTVNLTSQVITPIRLLLQIKQADNTMQNYMYYQWTQGTGSHELLTYPLERFKNADNCMWSLDYAPNKEVSYGDAPNEILSTTQLNEANKESFASNSTTGSSCKLSTTILDGQLVRVVDLNVDQVIVNGTVSGIATGVDENGNPYSVPWSSPYSYVVYGYCQYYPTLNATSVPDIPSLTYQNTGNIQIIFTDSNGWRWRQNLPSHSSMQTEILNKNNSTLDNYQSNTTGSQPTSPVGNINTIMFTTTTTCQLQLLKIGTTTGLPSDIKEIDGIQFCIFKEDAQTVKLYYVRGLPVKIYPYVPYVMPFTFNIYRQQINTWRGTPYVGYQCPWFWQDVNDSEGVATVLQFLRDSQTEYTTRANNGLKFFMQVFIWDRKDSTPYGTKNTWTWVGPDPNTGWGGYQYRAIETVAKCLFNDNTLTLAQEILTDFLKSINTVYTSGQPPTNFNQDYTVSATQIDINGTALLMRTCIYAIQSGVMDNALCMGILNKCLSYLDSIYTDPMVTTIFGDYSTIGTWESDGTWYMFHGGEMLQTLALLMEYTGNTVNIQSPSGQISINTIPEKFKDSNTTYTTIQTPSGQQYINLVATNDSNATDIIVKTDNGEKAIAIK